MKRFEVDKFSISLKETLNTFHHYHLFFLSLFTHWNQRGSLMSFLAFLVIKTEKPIIYELLVRRNILAQGGSDI